jgi:hypothetical protein
MDSRQCPLVPQEQSENEYVMVLSSEGLRQRRRILMFILMNVEMIIWKVE